MKPARNAPCPCGSGRKFKHCCGAATADAVPAGEAFCAPLAVEAPRARTSAAANRRCDGCTACCTALIINDAELVSPAGAACPHLCGSGCGVHGSGQPRTCREYHCNYISNQTPLTECERPDRVGAIVDRKRNPHASPPMDRTTHVVACAADGLVRVLDNHHWRSVIRHDLLAGVPILAAQHDDPLNREVLGVRLQEDRLYCRLTSCHADGSPVFKALQPVHDPPVEIALVISEQGFVFDAAVLIGLLGDRSHVVITPSARSSASEDLRFLFTRRQAEWAQALDDLRRECIVWHHVGDAAEAAVP